MKNKILILGMVLAVCCGSVHAQWVVTDPTNFAGNIANTVKEIATASKTVKNTLNNFKEVEKVYHQGKKYYDGAPVFRNTASKHPRTSKPQRAWASNPCPSYTLAARRSMASAPRNGPSTWMPPATQPNPNCLPTTAPLRPGR